MVESDKKSSFDKLVAGLNAEDRIAMLNRINQSSAQTVHFDSEITPKEKSISLRLRLQNESFLYKFILWLRSIFDKKSTEQLYSQDMLLSMAKKINHKYPGTINPKLKILDYIFYERLLTIKEAADFFKPYYSFVEDNPGDFYVFLSSFVAPDLAENINSKADPFIIPFDRAVTPELRTDLAKRMDELLNNMNKETKANIYYAVSASNWLFKFCTLQFIHFTAQFTNVSGSAYTCPYKNARMDFNELASVFCNMQPVQNEVLEALYLFSQRKSLTTNAQDKDIEKAVKEFMAKANTYFLSIKSFVNNVPMMKLGRVINDNYDWEPANLEGAEAWFPSFRAQWRKILEIRWNDWVKEQKKYQLSKNLSNDFGLETFPSMQYRPWLKLWNRIPFACELTGGFLSWFSTEKFPKIINYLNAVAMEGIFYRSENRTEYSEGLDNFSAANNMIIDLLKRLSPEGDYGRLFDDFSGNKMNNFQTQNQIESIMKDVEETIKNSIKLFGKGSRTIERVFFGFFEETKDGIHESLQNLNTIKGPENSNFKDALISIRSLLRKALFYISELEPIDAITE